MDGRRPPRHLLALTGPARVALEPSTSVRRLQRPRPAGERSGDRGSEGGGKDNSHKSWSGWKRCQAEHELFILDVRQAFDRLSRPLLPSSWVVSTLFLLVLFLLLLLLLFLQLMDNNRHHYHHLLCQLPAMKKETRSRLLAGRRQINMSTDNPLSRHPQWCSWHT